MLNGILLCEANQWPADVIEYFGDDDECQMAFHFPVMPRLYMGMSRHTRESITTILAATPPVPEGCQWATFLRMLPEYAQHCTGEGRMHDTAMLFGALGWEQYQGQAEVLCPYFESSGTGQVVMELPVAGRVVPSLGLEMPVS